MLTRDYARFILTAVAAYRARSLLTVTGIAFGIAAVVLHSFKFCCIQFYYSGGPVVATGPVESVESR